MIPDETIFIPNSKRTDHDSPPFRAHIEQPIEFSWQTDLCLFFYILHLIELRLLVVWDSFFCGRDHKDEDPKKTAPRFRIWKRYLIKSHAALEQSRKKLRQLRPCFLEFIGRHEHHGGVAGLHSTRSARRDQCRCSLFSKQTPKEKIMKIRES